MRTILLTGLSLTLMINIGCTSQSNNVNDTVEVLSNYVQLDSLMGRYSDQTLVVNFWATSCPPCLKEMPHFKELDSAFDGQTVKVLLVSLDRAEDLESRVYPFIQRLTVTPEVVLLDDENYSAWTDEIDPSWYGALPATIIKNPDTSSFRFGAYATYEELESDVRGVLEFVGLGD